MIKKTYYSKYFKKLILESHEKFLENVWLNELYLINAQISKLNIDDTLTKIETINQKKYY